MGKRFSVSTESINRFLEKIPLLYASLIFILLYVIGTFFIWYLKDPLKIIGAVIFGSYLSTFLIYLSEIINSYIFFNISNILGKEFLENSLKGRFKKFYDKLGEINLGWLFLLRAVPLIPYRALDISFGLSKLPYKKYLLVVLLASPPRIFWIQFILASLKGVSFENLIGYFAKNRVIFLLSLLYFIFATIVAFKIKRKITVDTPNSNSN
jgi:uncharacterized membrane protein YdjX (TVP38/TMEM64 family)